VIRSTNNIPDAKVLHASYLNIRDLLVFDKVLIPVARTRPDQSESGIGRRYKMTTIYDVLHRPIVTEKVQLSGQYTLHQYVFEVANDANRTHGQRCSGNPLSCNCRKRVNIINAPAKSELARGAVAAWMSAKQGIKKQSSP
jgi:hypothetical protein